MRVKWECGAEGCSKGVHEGEIWIPHNSVRVYLGETDYEVAKRLGLTCDQPPAGDHVMLSHSCQGVIYVRRVAGTMPSVNPETVLCQAFWIPPESTMVT